MEGQEFESFIGGDQRAPSSVSIMKFATSRAQEIQALTETIECASTGSGGLVFQSLPRHMRRRAMSHNTKRLPRRLREAHQRQCEKSGLSAKTKRPRRSYRRRPQNLLVEYNRRQRKCVWLETHVWHAKRFHMVEKWGYKLAHFPNEKSFRACYRASTKHCLLQDVSYLNCIELEGYQGHLLEGLSVLCNPNCGLTFAAKLYLNSSKEGAVMLFHKGQYPFGAIGEVTFFWGPENRSSVKSGSSDYVERKLWLWTHPSYHNDVVNELTSVFGLSRDDNEEPMIVNGSEDSKENIKIKVPQVQSDDSERRPQKKRRKIVREKVKKNVDQIKLETRNVPFVRTPKYANGNEPNIKMVLLKDTLCRLRLIGPLSQSILCQTLKPFVSKNDKMVGETSVITERGRQGLKRYLDSDLEDGFSKRDWWTHYYGGLSGCSMQLSVQNDLWKQICLQTSSPPQLPPNVVLPLTILDPRLIQPDCKQPSHEDHSATGLVDGNLSQRIESISKTAGCISSPIWESTVRDVVTTTKMSDCELNQIRSRRLVPGEPLAEELKNASVIPVLLVQRPGNRDPKRSKLGLGGGWDIIAPAGWAMALWMALVFRGARVGGLREAQAVRFESGILPDLAPDSKSGSLEDKSIEETLRQNYFRKPPKKRPNFVKLGALSPFRNLWKILISDWLGKEVDSFFVLRDLQQLKVLKDCKSVDKSGTRGKDITRLSLKIASGITLRKKKSTPSVQLKIEEASSARETTPVNKKIPILTDFPDVRSLVGIKLLLKDGGSLVDFASICLPEKDDVISKKSPTESPHHDKHTEVRRKCQNEHKQLMKRLRRQRVRAKRLLEEQQIKRCQSKMEECDSDNEDNVVVKGHKGDTKAISEEYVSQINDLWLPERVDSVKDVCARKIIGYVCSGGFCYTEAQGTCTGYIVLPALLELLATQTWNPELCVLLRNPTSLHYFFATFQIL